MGKTNDVGCDWMGVRMGGGRRAGVAARRGTLALGSRWLVVAGGRQAAGSGWRPRRPVACQVDVGGSSELWKTPWGRIFSFLSLYRNHSAKCNAEIANRLQQSSTLFAFCKFARFICKDTKECGNQNPASAIINSLCIFANLQDQFARIPKTCPIKFPDSTRS